MDAAPPPIIALSFPSRRSLFFWKHPSPDANMNECTGRPRGFITKPAETSRHARSTQTQTTAVRVFSSGNLHAPFYLVFM